jgi:predicted nucleic acid-binding protein
VSAFFDTNVLVYCTDATAPKKQTLARQLVARSTAAGEAVLSTQVLIELYHTLIRKQRMPVATAQALTQAYGVWPVIASDLALVNAAIERSIQHKLSIWDAMVIAAALRAQVETLYSEDLTHGQRFGELTVVNPFLAHASAGPSARRS